jgi:hypothetical protein
MIHWEVYFSLCNLSALYYKDMAFEELCLEFIIDQVFC